jgi:hypothetical protein
VVVGGLTSDVVTEVFGLYRCHRLANRFFGVVGAVPVSMLNHHGI